MKPKIEESEEAPFLSAEVDSEEEKIWMNPRVSPEAVLCHEGLVVFQLFEGRRRSDDY